MEYFKELSFDTSYIEDVNFTTKKQSFVDFHKLAESDGIFKMFRKTILQILKGQCQVLIYCWLLPLLVKIDGVILELKCAKLFARYHEKAVSTKINGNATYTNFSSQCVYGRKVFQMVFKEKHNR